MRTLPKAALTAALTATMAASFVAPSSAAAWPVACPKGEDICVYLSGTYDVTNPVAIGPVSSTARYVKLPAICNSTGTDCITPYVGIPGAGVASTGGSLGTLHIPGTGIGINSATGEGTLYVTDIPTFTPSGGGAGIEASVTLFDFPVIVAMNGIGYECGYPGSTTTGPLTTTYGGCATTYTVKI